MSKYTPDQAARAIAQAYKWAKDKKDALERATHDDSVDWAEFDRILDSECRAEDRLAEALTEYTDGAITENEAYLMVTKRFGQIGELVARLAL